MRFDGRVVLITGGAGAIAGATGRAFADEGATVVLAGRDAGNLAAAAERIGGGGGKVDWIAADVTDSRQVAGLVVEVVGRHGGLHVAVNSAGVFTAPVPLADLDEADWARHVDVNLTGVFLAMKHEIAHMRANGGGVIVNIASNIGAHGRRPGLAAYAATKAAVSALTRAAARDHIADGVRIKAVSPGASDTPMSYRPGESRADRDARVRTAVPAGRVSDPAEVAAVVLWLASDESSFVVGHDVVVDGGATA
ncbi:NAD(P)-dependent dehydrogenase (short-subunit alcohol dehydrogenase family) [Asanoa ferruginea]|uniref:NAD(P)-dependent dehydrogenase (Short-subunit alcohol dehydrogenase family) n=1 Tax=Asanoa ferruginea TaxID=53367 RepID=A0A3E0A116_9ACTN|nr:SDR family oxidoreductase [Asanoa ferruginea]REG02114.1 NAD(P)-dependent dehydrogenase (short-subunit alcohol dehydrogenase family) [Asanoa ferruginea]GIF48590.1 short-chain dehydrogenase [Asanoa ferruginea]